MVAVGKYAAIAAQKRVKGESSPLQDTKWRQPFWNLANQFIRVDADCQNYSEYDCDGLVQVRKMTVKIILTVV